MADGFRDPKCDSAQRRIRPSDIGNPASMSTHPFAAETAYTLTRRIRKPRTPGAMLSTVTTSLSLISIPSVMMIAPFVDCELCRLATVPLCLGCGCQFEGQRGNRHPMLYALTRLNTDVSFAFPHKLRRQNTAPSTSTA